MLHGAEKCGNATSVVIIADLCLGICTEHLSWMILQQLQELGCYHVWNRHLLCRFVCSVTVHDSLVTGTTLIHAECDVRRLFVHQNADANSVAKVEAHLLRTNVSNHIVYELMVVRLIVSRHLASNKELVLLQQAFDCDTRILVVLQNIRHDGVCNLVTDFIGMAVADLFTGNDLAHGSCPPSLSSHFLYCHSSYKCSKAWNCRTPPCEVEGVSRTWDSVESGRP